MGSNRGYAYGYKFSLGDLSEMKSSMLTAKPDYGQRPVVLEMRTVFGIFWKKTRNGGVREIIGEESFDICMIYENSSVYTVLGCVSSRLEEYWMGYDEIEKFCEEMVAYVGEIAGKHDSLDRIPVYVDFEVCTVQQEGEVYTATEARAIKPSKLDPTYLIFYSTPPTGVEIDLEFKFFIADLHRTRVENVEEGLGIMSTCTLCNKGPDIGDRIAKLYCGCCFHSQCVVGWFEKDNHCPICEASQFAAFFVLSKKKTTYDMVSEITSGMVSVCPC